MTEAHPDELFEVVGDLGTYPHWLDLVAAAEPDGEPEAWSVTLRARVGPLARSKRLRMVRTRYGDGQVRFERREIDGRHHSDWVLTATVTASCGTDGPGTDGPGTDRPMRSEVLIDLSYAGSLWSGLLDGILDATAESATTRLQAYVKS